MSTMTVAAVQLVSGADFDENLRRICQLTESAVSDYGARLILLPENCLCMQTKRQLALAAELDKHMNRFEQSLQNLCDSHQIAIIAGSMPFLQDTYGDKVSASHAGQRVAPITQFYAPKANANDAHGVIARYQKIHLFDVDIGDAQGQYRESDGFAPGDRAVLADWQGLRVGLSICYDLRFPALYQHLRALGADLITVPAAFTYKTGAAHWEVLLRARAIENQCYVLASNQGGQHTPNRETWGHSMIVDPWGRVLAQCQQGEAVIAAEIDLSLLATLRQDMPVLQHRRHFC